MQRSIHPKMNYTKANATDSPKEQIDPDAILTSDWHLREDPPICRTDNFWEAQWKKVAFVRRLQRKYNCPVLHAGDLFHHWKPSPYLLSKTIQCLPDQFMSCYGQHDIPQHNLGLAEKSGLHTLVQAGKVQLCGTHFGQSPPQGEVLLPTRSGQQHRILLWHKFAWTDRKPWPTCIEMTAEELIEKYDNSLIVLGDNHTPFVIKRNDKLLVNPGSLTRQTADQINHRPRVYLWYSMTAMVEAVFIPIEEGVISREHIEVNEARDQRIEAFIRRLSDDWQVDLSFERNLENFAKENDIKPEVMEIIRRAVNNE